MDGCRLTLIFTLEIHKKESDRPQAVVLSFLRATHGGRRASAKVKVCKLTFRPRSSQLRSSVLSICCDSKGKKDCYQSKGKAMVQIPVSQPQFCLNFSVPFQSLSKFSFLFSHSKCAQISALILQLHTLRAVVSPGQTLCKALKQSNVQNHSYFDSVTSFIFLYGIK